MAEGLRSPGPAGQDDHGRDRSTRPRWARSPRSTGTPVVTDPGAGDEGRRVRQRQLEHQPAVASQGLVMRPSSPMTTDVASEPREGSRPRLGRGRLRARPAGRRLPADGAVLRLRHRLPAPADRVRPRRRVPDRGRRVRRSTTSAPSSGRAAFLQAFGRSIQLSVVTALVGASLGGLLAWAVATGGPGRLAPPARRRGVRRPRPVRRRDARVRVPRDVRLQRPRDGRLEGGHGPRHHCPTAPGSTG